VARDLEYFFIAEIQLLLAIDVPRGLELARAIIVGNAEVLSLLKICRAIWRHIAKFGLPEMPEIPKMNLDYARSRM
jgi:hypothetical protein